MKSSRELLRATDIESDRTSKHAIEPVSAILGGIVVIGSLATVIGLLFYVNRDEATQESVDEAARSRRVSFFRKYIRRRGKIRY